MWLFWNNPAKRGRSVALYGFQRARFRRPVVPDDVLRLSAELRRRRGEVYSFRGTATVRGQPAAETVFLAGLTGWEEQT